MYCYIFHRIWDTYEKHSCIILPQIETANKNDKTSEFEAHMDCNL